MELETSTQCASSVRLNNAEASAIHIYVNNLVGF